MTDTLRPGSRLQNRLRAEARLKLAAERLAPVLAAVESLADRLEADRLAGLATAGADEGAWLWERLSPLLGVPGLLMDAADCLEGRPPGTRGPGIVTTPLAEREAALSAGRPPALPTRSELP